MGALPGAMRKASSSRSNRQIPVTPWCLHGQLRVHAQPGGVWDPYWDAAPLWDGATVVTSSTAQLGTPDRAWVWSKES